MTNEQIAQAYNDRTLQLPRREYSDATITARKQLLEEAYQVLSDSEKRSAYDAQFLETISQTEIGESQESTIDPYTAWIEIQSDQLVAALLILQELGEYELVLRLGYLHVNNQQQSLSSSEIVRGDLILTLALAYLELSREHWQQQEYEKAAATGNNGLELLVEENLFPKLQQEIRSDLYKLRPYRILELLTLQEDKVAQREKGLHLLREMLQERQGIDGKGDDGSGLSRDQFLGFIQQLRIHLTVKEQQELFASNPQPASAADTYLAIYVLLAGGFSQRNPALIIQANEMLKRLSKRQDVYLEQAICALLLGQTQEASLVLEYSNEDGLLKFIREQSQGSPDLLPGLCLYGEYWLQTDVFSHFRDLTKQKASLTEYFADDGVQNYLEQLPVATYKENQESDNKSKLETKLTAVESDSHDEDFLPEQIAQGGRESVGTRSRNNRRQALIGSTGSGAATLRAPATPYYVGNRGSALPAYQEDYSESQGEKLVVTASYRQSPVKSSHQSDTQTLSKIPEDKDHSLVRRRGKPRRIIKVNRLRLGMVIFFSLLGIGSLGLLLRSLHNNYADIPGLTGEQLFIYLHQPPVQIPSADAQMILPQGVLTKEGAEQVLESWLLSKSQAFGAKHQIEQLSAILEPSLLSNWRNRGERLKISQDYWEYKHDIEVKSLKTNPQSPEQAIVEAQVREVASYYQKGKLNQNKSYDDNLLIRYELVRQQDRWLIKDIKVLN